MPTQGKTLFMKTLFAALALLICSSFAFGDTIGPATGCADSACLGASYTLNVINYSGNQLTVDYIIDATKFTNGTGTVLSGHTDGIFALALNFSIPVSGVSSDGFNSTALPAIKPITTSPIGIEKG